MVKEYVPLGITVDAVNKHDMKMTKTTLQSIVIDRPEPSTESKQYMCKDRGYDFPEVYELLLDYAYTIHIKLKTRSGKQTQRKKRKRLPTYRSRHWVDERTHSRMNRFRRLLIRWEKKLENYIGMLHFACAWITYRNAGLFG